MEANVAELLQALIQRMDQSDIQSRQRMDQMLSRDEDTRGMIMNLQLAYEATSVGLAQVQSGRRSPVQEPIQNETQNQRPELPTQTRNSNDRPSLTGRATLLVAQNNTENPAAGPVPGAVPIATNTAMIHTQERVPEGQQIKYVSLTALKVAVENQAAHMAQFDQFRGLAFFMSATVLRLLVENEHRHGRNTEMTEASIMRRSDESLLDMFTSYVRINSMNTKKGFTTTILGAVPRLKPDGGYERELELRDYDKYFHAPVNKHLNTLERVLEYAFRKSTRDETESWPEPGYGKGDDFGIVRILLKTLDPYQDNFVNKIGMGEIKSWKTTGEFFRAVRRINDDVANESARTRKKDSEMKPGLKLGQVADEINQKRAAPRVEHTRDGPRDARLPMTPANRTNRYPGQGYPRPDRSSGRNAMLDAEDSYLDVTANCDNPLWSPQSRDLLSPERETDEYGWGIFPEEEESGYLNAMQSGRGPHAGAQRLYDPKATPRDPTRGCWRHFESKSCPGNCGWDHSNEAMQKLGREKMNALFNSPYMPLESILREGERRKAERAHSPRNASLTMVFKDGQPTTEEGTVALDPQFAEVAKLSGFQPEVTLNRTQPASSSASKSSS